MTGTLLAALLLAASPAPGETKFAEGMGFLKSQPRFSLSDAAAAFGEACKQGHPHACVQLGLLLQDGRGVARNASRAAELYGKACEAGAGVGCFNLGGLTYLGNGVAEDPAKAMELYKKAEPLYRAACDAGDLQWCTNLGVLYEGPYLGPADPAKAVAVYKKACDKKAGEWCVNLALMQAHGEGMPRDPKAAAKLLDKACGAGVQLSCGALGQMYVNPNYGFPSQPAKAMPLLTKACESGEAQACGVASALYALGDKVKGDPALAKKYGERACALGSAEACFAEGMGHMEAARFSDAFTWLERSCFIGHPNGCVGSAMLAEAGKGVKADAARAIGLRKDACRLGDGASCMFLLEKGEALPLGAERQRAFLDEGCKRSIPGTCR